MESHGFSDHVSQAMSEICLFWWCMDIINYFYFIFTAKHFVKNIPKGVLGGGGKEDGHVLATWLPSLIWLIWKILTIWSEKPVFHVENWKVRMDSQSFESFDCFRLPTGRTAKESGAVSGLKINKF